MVSPRHNTTKNGRLAAVASDIDLIQKYPAADRASIRQGNAKDLWVVTAPNCCSGLTLSSIKRTCGYRSPLRVHDRIAGGDELAEMNDFVELRNMPTQISLGGLGYLVALGRSSSDQHPRCLATDQHRQ
jgi:hypothetical protein